jgi:hypothetical protein
MQIESQPALAIISAVNELGMESQPFSTQSPRFQIVLIAFSLI